MVNKFCALSNVGALMCLNIPTRARFDFLKLKLLVISAKFLADTGFDEIHFLGFKDYQKCSEDGALYT